MVLRFLAVRLTLLLNKQHGLVCHGRPHPWRTTFHASQSQCAETVTTAHQVLWQSWIHLYGLADLQTDESLQLHGNVTSLPRLLGMIQVPGDASSGVRLAMASINQHGPRSRT